VLSSVQQQQQQPRQHTLNAEVGLRGEVHRAAMYRFTRSSSSSTSSSIAWPTRRGRNGHWQCRLWQCGRRWVDGAAARQTIQQHREASLVPAATAAAAVSF
jgi:hypothetical protein